MKCPHSSRPLKDGRLPVCGGGRPACLKWAGWMLPIPWTTRGSFVPPLCIGLSELVKSGPPWFDRSCGLRLPACCIKLQLLSSLCSSPDGETERRDGNVRRVNSPERGRADGEMLWKDERRGEERRESSCVRLQELCNQQAEPLMSSSTTRIPRQSLNSECAHEKTPPEWRLVQCDAAERISGAQQHLIRTLHFREASTTPASHHIYHLKFFSFAFLAFGPFNLSYGKTQPRRKAGLKRSDEVST